MTMPKSDHYLVDDILKFIHTKVAKLCLHENTAKHLGLRITAKGLGFTSTQFGPQDFGDSQITIYFPNGEEMIIWMNGQINVGTGRWGKFSWEDVFSLNNISDADFLDAIKVAFNKQRIRMQQEKLRITEALKAFRS